MQEDVPENNNQNRLITANNSNLNDVNINAVTREFLRNNPEYGVINIPDFLNNTHVIHNPSGENYATSLQILLPWAETVTPMVTQSIKIYKLDEDNNPDEILGSLSLDDATLYDENEPFEVEKGDVVFMVEKSREDDPSTTGKDEKSFLNKCGAFVADGSKTIWNTGKKAAFWIWKNGGSQLAEDIARGAIKVGVGIAVDYLSGGSSAATAAATAAAQSFINGSRAPVAIEAPLAQNTQGQLLPFNINNLNVRSKTRTREVFPNGYPDIEEEHDLYFNPERLFQISYSIIKFPTNFWTNLNNNRRNGTQKMQI